MEYGCSVQLLFASASSLALIFKALPLHFHSQLLLARPLNRVRQGEWQFFWIVWNLHMFDTHILYIMGRLLNSECLNFKFKHGFII